MAGRWSPQRKLRDLRLIALLAISLVCAPLHSTAAELPSIDNGNSRP